ncbi:B12-binding domain-containing radical SAM protein [Candidatus Omnitrophota bacterium]
MKILLVKPYNISDHIQPSLGLGYLATSVRGEHEVTILDCIKERTDIFRLKNIIGSSRFDLIGIQCYTFDLKFVKNALTMIKGIDAKIITVIGGPHPSAEPKETMGYFGEVLDFAFIGEAERGFKSLVDYLNAHKLNISEIPGLAWREDGIVKMNNPYFEQDLDKFGMVAWDLIRPDTYPESQHGAFYKKFPIAPIMLTRGCPYDCTFCAGKVITGKKLRKRSVNHVISEVKFLYDTYGIREFHIVDDNFTMDREYAKRFLEELETLHLDISWALPNGIRMENLDIDFLCQMKRTGLYLVSLGIESGSDRVLGLMKKNLKVDKMRKAVQLITDSGLDAAGFFIMGFPGETREEIDQTIKFSLELNLIRANFFMYLPFPGTESYLKLKETGELNKVNLDEFYFFKAAYNIDGMTSKELKWLQRKAFLKFYLRPRIFFKNMLGIKSVRHFKFLFRRFVNWISRG